MFRFNIPYLVLGKSLLMNGKLPFHFYLRLNAIAKHSARLFSKRKTAIDMIWTVNDKSLLKNFA